MEFISLHTSDPKCDASEVAYEGYARMPVAARVEFPECLGGGARVTHFQIGDVSGEVVPAIKVFPGVTPILERII